MIESEIDLVNVSAGIHETPETLHRMFPHTSFTEHGCNVYLAEAVKSVKYSSNSCWRYFRS